MTRSQRFGIAAGLALLTSIVFSQVRTHEFVDFDDLVYIASNPHITDGVSATGIVEAFTTPFHSQWTPLSRISLQLNHAVHGLEPAGYLLTNLALHIASSVLLFFAMSRMTNAVWASAFVAAVFALHPLHVESVAWSAERKDCVSGLFWMLTLLAYARYAERPGGSRYAAVTASLALGLLSKPMLVTLPFVLILLDIWPLARFSRRTLVEKIPWLALAAAVSGITFAVQKSGGAADYGEIISFPARLNNAIASYGIYATKAFWPTDLAPFYPHPNSAEITAASLLGAGALLAISLGVLWLRRSRPYLLVGWLWYLGTLAPVIGIVQVGMQARADRYMYLPLVGLSIAVTWGALGVARSRGARRLLASGGVVAVAAMAASSWTQVGYWSDTITLFEHNLSVEPDSYYAHKRLATLRLRELQFEKAEFHYRRVFEILPEEGRNNLVRFHLMMADLAQKRSDWYQALYRFEQAVAVDPNSGRANGLLGLVLLALDRPDEARPYLEKTHEIHPTAIRIQMGLAQVAASEANWAQALKFAEMARSQAAETGDEELEATLSDRIESYRSHAPYLPESSGSTP